MLLSSRSVLKLQYPFQVHKKNLCKHAESMLHLRSWSQRSCRRFGHMLWRLTHASSLQPPVSLGASFPQWPPLRAQVASKQDFRSTPRVISPAPHQLHAWHSVMRLSFLTQYVCSALAVFLVLHCVFSYALLSFIFLCFS